MKRLILFMALIITVSFGWAQKANEAKTILDKTAQKLNAKGGVKASFKLSGKMGSASGTIAVKGSKFHASTPSSVVWYDGKTQWTYMKNNEEVNVSTPTEAQQQAINPYKFIYLYKSGYTLGLSTVGANWQVHLTATNKSRALKELYITVDKNYQLKQVKMRQQSGWTTISVSNIQKSNLSDSYFRFSSKDYPNAEVIDLR